MPPSKPPPSYPPAYHHKSTLIAPSSAQTLLADFMVSSEHNPFLHPTSILSSTGITHGPNSGPSGGLAMHHLRRIEAGLRGESLIAETNEELREQFGYSELEGYGRVMRNAPSYGETIAGLRESDDTRLDAAITASTTENEGTIGKRMNESNKRKRSSEEISAWAEESSRVESLAADGEDLTTFEQSRRPIVGEVGNRDMASTWNGNGTLSIVNGHSNDNGIESPKKKPKTAGDIAARRATKKARRKAEKTARHLATVTS